MYLFNWQITLVIKSFSRKCDKVCFPLLVKRFIRDGSKNWKWFDTPQVAKETKARKKNNRSLEKRPYPILSGFLFSRKRWSRIIPKEWKLLAASSESMHRVTTMVSGRSVKCNAIFAAFEMFRLDLKRCCCSSCWSVLPCRYLTFPIYGNTMLRYEQQTLTTLFCTLKSDFLDVKSLEF